jgi:hypothetical protein
MLKSKFFYPIYSKTNATKNPIKNTSILVNTNFYILNEINAQRIIQTIPNKEHFFYLFETIEYITYNELKKEDMFLESSNIIHNNTNKVLLTYKDKQIYNLYDYISNHTNLLLKHRLIIDSYSYLLDSIHLLLKNNLVHNNINTNTICIHDLNECKPIIMKFNQSIHISLFYNRSTTNIKDFNFIQSYLLEFDSSNNYLPLEFHLLSFIFSNKLNSLSKINITTFINNIYNEENLLFLLEKKNNIKIIEYYKKETELYLNNYINCSIEEIINNIFEYYLTWDNYRLSILYLKISIQIKSETESETFFPNFIQLLIHNIHPNPMKRFSIEKTKEEFYQYF